MQKSCKLKYTAPTFIVLIFGLISSSFPLNAQTTVEIGFKTQPSIEVDFSVLNDLPLEPTLPELLFRQSRTQTIQNKDSRFSNFRTRHQFVKSTKIPRPRAKTNKNNKIIRSIPQKRGSTLTKLVSKPTHVQEQSNSTSQSNTKPVKTSISVESSPKKTSGSKNVARLKESKQPKKTPNSEESNEFSNKNKLQIVFSIGQSDITDIAVHKLDAISEVLKEEKASRVQLLAYAQAPSGNESRARRLSLARALSVRSYLVKKGLTTTRMDVRALGSRAKKGPKDRVDVMLVPQ